MEMKKLDKIDIALLNILQQNARITNKELAAQLGLSITPIFERIKKLEKSGFIKKYVALVDNEKVDKAMVAFMFVSAVKHNYDALQRAFKYMQELPEVMECYHISGDHDYLLKVVVKDMKEYENFLLKKLSTYDYIARIKSVFVLSTVKYNQAFELLTNFEEDEE
ncbi:MAG: hypothetical protein RIS47_1545 [Bacteroidota bacterium]|jgi:DNA-binding Lrp family transcriptional regulator